MSMEHWWNDTDGKREVLREKPDPETLFSPFKYHMDLLQIEHGPPRVDAFKDEN